MNLRVRALDFSYDDDGYTVKDVNARFEIVSTDGSFLNGAVRITKEEYDTIGTSGILEVASLVKVKIKEQIANL